MSFTSKKENIDYTEEPPAPTEIKFTNASDMSESEIREEIEKAILIGFLNKDTRHKWDSLFGSGRLPSPEEFITVLSIKVARS